MCNSTVTGALKPTTLRAAGKLAMFSALLALPLFLLSLLLEGRHDTTARAIHLALQGCGTAIFVALALSFRCFLNRNCGFYRVDTIILWLIVVNFVYAVASSASIFGLQGEEQMRPILMCLIVILGLLQIGLGLRLFAMENDLDGLKRPYCWLNVATGFFLATLVMIPVGIITSAVADVMLGTIFIMEARRLALLSEAKRLEDKEA